MVKKILITKWTKRSSLHERDHKNRGPVTLRRWRSLTFKGPQTKTYSAQRQDKKTRLKPSINLSINSVYCQHLRCMVWFNLITHWREEYIHSWYIHSWRLITRVSSIEQAPMSVRLLLRLSYCSTSQRSPIATPKLMCSTSQRSPIATPKLFFNKPELAYCNI